MSIVIFAVLSDPKMKIQHILYLCLFLAFSTQACKESASSSASSPSNGSGLKIAFVNGDTILHKFEEFRKQGEVMDAKQRQLEEQLQTKGAALEKEIMAYQQKAQSGVLTGKEMEAREKYLASRQEALLAERDKMAKELMAESESINKRLQKVLHEKLDAIKAKDGYDFILSYVEGGAILSADEKYDITDQVLKMLNESGAPLEPDTTKK